MRLAEFILSHVEPILVEWESFARSIWPGTPGGRGALRDHAEDILRAAIADMASAQTPVQQEEKSKGEGTEDGTSVRVDLASELHGALRGEAGFNIAEVIAEYRALRASVLRLWQESDHDFHREDLNDVTRFNEAIDQSLANAAESYERNVEANRKSLADERIARMGAEAGDQAKHLFLMTLSHEMRTPLNAIAGWAGVLAKKSCTDEMIAEGVEVITRNVTAQVKLIDDILDVASIVGGKLTLAIDDCDVVAFINDAVQSMQAAVEAKGIVLTAELDCEERTIPCDGDRMRQVVWNLLSNAVKFTPDGGKVNVSLTHDGDMMRLGVVDTGIGIAPEFLPHVFERFRQADASVSRQFVGIGLGLAIVKQIVELHGGKAEAFSAGTGHGATFTVILPTTAKRRERSGQTKTAAA